MIINVNDFAAQGKDAIQAAVDACGEVGSGTVFVPSKEWETGPIHLRSHVHIKLEEGAVLRFSSRFEDYLPVVFTRWEGMECYNYSPLIYAKDCEDIAVTGKGTLIGSGQAWWHWKKLQQEAANELCYAQSKGVPVEKRIYGTVQAALRPSFIQPVSCKNVLLSDFTVTDGPQWTIHPVYCEDVVVRNVTVSTHGPNTDGLNPDSCKNVLIEDCTFDTGDDCIAINSGMNEDGWRVNRPCENITIRRCTMNGGHGGVVIGSAMSGGVRNIFASDCKITGTDQGIRLKSMRGRGGYVEHVRIENIAIDQVRQQAIQINMFYGSSTVVPKSQTPPVFRDIMIKNVQGKGAETGIEIKGLPEQLLKDISLENVHLSASQAMVCTDVEGMTMDDVTVTKGGKENE